MQVKRIFAFSASAAFLSFCCNGIFRRTGCNGAFAIRNEMELRKVVWRCPVWSRPSSLVIRASQGLIRSVSSFPPDLRSPRIRTLIYARSTALSGTWHTGYGEKAEASGLKELPAGSFYAKPQTLLTM